jgi:YspA, cpYpsA-related SLOG family
MMPPGRVVLVTGGRSFTDGRFVASVLTEMDAARATLRLIHGGAQGTDHLAGLWAELFGVPIVRVLANWHLLGRAAGPRRNQEMVDMAPDLVIAFPGGSGTADCVARARARGLPVMEVRP